MAAPVFHLRDPDAVFIHIPKTGGQSIRNGLWEKRFEHPVLEPYRSRVMSKTLPTFAMIRHPLDRVASACRFCLGDKADDRAAIAWFVDVITSPGLYEDASVAFGDEQFCRHHALPMSHDFYRLFDHENVRIMRFERFEDEVELLKKDMGLDHLPTPHVNATPGKPWRRLFTKPQLRCLVKFYEADFDNFGYERPDPASLDETKAARGGRR